MANGNYSGFSGYTYANIYPQWGSGVDQREDTVPDPVEQQAYANMGDMQAPAAVDKKLSVNVWVIFAVLVGLIVLFGRG